MAVCVELLPQSCRLLILGGGEQGCRRAEAYLSEGGSVTVNALTFCPRLQQLAGAQPRRLRLVQGDFDPALLREVQLFYAASDDGALNARALALAGQAGVLAASATPCPEASARFLKAECTGGLTLACGTDGSYPALASPLMEALTEAAEPYSRRLPLLRELRGRVLSLGLPREKTTPVLRSLTGFSPASLQVLALLDDAALESTLFERKTGMFSTADG